MNRFVSQPIIGHLAAVIITSRCQRGRRFALIKAAHYRFWTWLAFGLRVVGVTHDVWVRPICTKRVRFDHFLAGTRARRRRIQEGQKSEHGFLRRSDWRPAVLGHTFLVTKNRHAHSSHHFWTVAETITPYHAPRLFQILFWGKQFSLRPAISKDF